MKHKKTSIDFYPDNYDILEKSAALYNLSKADIVNRLVETFLLNTEDVEYDLMNFCREKYDETYENLKTTDRHSFEFTKLMKEMRNWETMSIFWGYQSEKYLERIISEKYNKTFVKNGVLFSPKDYVFLDEISCKPEDATSIFVVECRNGVKYGVPHYLILNKEPYSSDLTKIIDDNTQSKIYSAIEKVLPNYSEVRRMESEFFAKSERLRKIKLEDRTEEDIKLNRKLIGYPQFGIFNVIEQNNPFNYNNFTKQYDMPNMAFLKLKR